MDAKTIYSLLKPHLDSMNAVEKRSLTRLISGKASPKTSRILPVALAKEKIRRFRKKAMEKEA